MKRIFYFSFFILSIFIMACDHEEKPVNIEPLFGDLPSLVGKPEYAESPYVTAGDRMYIVGHQDGTFPDLGWHLEGEMGGVWSHPYKLLDGFEMEIGLLEDSLDTPDILTFHNYPVGNRFHYEWKDKEMSMDRWQFVPDGVNGAVVVLDIYNNSDKDRNVGLRLSADFDIRPTWLGEQTDMENKADFVYFNREKRALLGKDGNTAVAVGSYEIVSNYYTDAKDSIDGSSNANLMYAFNIPANSHLSRVAIIAGSNEGEEGAFLNLQTIKSNWETGLRSKIDRFKGIESQTKLSTPDSRLNECFEWLKYNCDWLVRDVPSIGRGMGAGLPDYPWWFGVDSEYALKGYLAIGRDDIARSTVALLDSISAEVNGDGRIIHEVSTNGAVYNPGNINETPQFATLIWDLYAWTGDKSVLETYFPTVQKGMKWVLNDRDRNKNMFPEGYGMMEIHGMDSEMVDVASYTYQGLQAASKMAKVLGDEVLASSYQEKSVALGRAINDRFWSEDFKSYADFIGTDEQALALIEDAIIRADSLEKPWAVDELNETKQRIVTSLSSDQKPFVVHHNWVVNTPMEVGLADREKAISALNTAKKFTNPYGLFVTGIDRDESAGTTEGSFQGSKVFSYTGAVMTLPTGVLAVAENNYGRPDEALDYLQRMTKSFSYALPGSMYEVSPDYGMFTQAWNIYSFAIPIVRQFFGISPRADLKSVEIAPMMPTAWNEASLENVSVGDNSISIKYSTSQNGTVLSISQSIPDWQITIPKTILGKEYEVTNGTGNERGESLILTGTTIEVRYNK